MAFVVIHPAQWRLDKGAVIENLAREAVSVRFSQN
jgi:hypothetical protein